MSDTLLVGIISGVVTIIVTALTVWAGMRKQSQEMAVALAVTKTQIDELTREVRKHNGFAERMPVVEEQIKSLNTRVKDLEGACRT
jgi:uncharacterized membrane-anchored protein YhcB (DUF1043 family)